MTTRDGEADDRGLLGVGMAFADAWNRHDPKALAALWTQTGDFVNPFGRMGKGPAEIEAIFAEEHATVFRDTTYAFEIRRIQMFHPEVVVATWDGLITGLKDPEGIPQPAFVHIVTVVAVRKGARWKLMTVRPMVPAPLPSWAPKSVAGA